jgi:predicted GH43/DUF377 family glycosyl hydrolase
MFLFLCVILVNLYLGLKYNVTFKILNNQDPIISSLIGNSKFKWNYNAAIVPWNNGSYSLLVRCQNQKDPNDPYSTTPSILGLSNLIKSNGSIFNFSTIIYSNIVFKPQESYESYGTEDPRIIFYNGTYYMLYSAVQDYYFFAFSRLALATSVNPADPKSWNRYGPLFNWALWSKSGAMIVRDPPPHYLIFGDTNWFNGLQMAISKDLISWHQLPGTILDIRPDKFDSNRVEAGPMPLKLTDGNYLFLYNSARKGYPSPKPNYDLQYNVGYAILDKNNPTSVIERSDQPLITPTLDGKLVCILI